MIDKETMTDPIEIERSLDVKIQTLEKETNLDPIDIKHKKYAYIEILSTNRFLKVSKDEVSKIRHKIQGCLVAS